jgi:hypothetical protein
MKVKETQKIATKGNTYYTEIVRLFNCNIDTLDIHESGKLVGIEVWETEVQAEKSMLLSIEDILIEDETYIHNGEIVACKVVDDGVHLFNQEGDSFHKIPGVLGVVCL